MANPKSTLDEFMISLLRKELINLSDFKGNMNEIKDLYDSQYKNAVRQNFSWFRLQLWKKYYVWSWKANSVLFDENWVRYFASQITDGQNNMAEARRSSATHKTQYTGTKTDDSNEVTIKIENVAFPKETDDKVNFVINASYEGTLHLTNITTQSKFAVVKNFDASNKTFDIAGQGDYDESSLELILHSKNGQCYYDIPIDIENYGKKNDFIIKGVKPIQYAEQELRPLKANRIPKDLLRQLRSLVKKYPEFTQRMPKLEELATRGFQVTANTNLAELQKAFFKKCATILKVPTKLAEASYCTMLEKLLHIEEFQMQEDIHYYDRPGPHFKTSAVIQFEREYYNRAKNKLFCLYQMEVDGLAEGRPSLLKNDSVFVRYGADKKFKFEGVVHKTRSNVVVLGFHRMFEKVHVREARNQKFRVEFGFNRRPLKVEKQAVELAKEHHIIPYFFPNSKKLLPATVPANELNFFNKSLNEEQKRAVRNILDMKPVPYLVFGPPGTGKTVTIVEAILQIWKNQPDSRILVCTPSNAAADVITRRLQDIIPKMYMYRLCGHTYGEAFRGILKHGEAISNVKDGQLYMPSTQFLLGKRVVLTTLVTATRLVNGEVPIGHFSYVFIDEGGYATETESLLPIIGILTSENKKSKICGQVVLVGDPRQLGPRIHSNFNKFCQYDVSMLERLIDTCAIYARDESKPVPYDERCITKLLVNYRSHKAILHVPNQLFYHGELQPASDNMSQLFVGWEGLRNGSFPVVFHNVEGDDKKDKTSPSFFNETEVKTVMKYIERLLKDTKVKGKTIREEDIGVITPYRRQIEKIKNECGKMKINKINVGSVQLFQGKESLITIISTVRSKNAATYEKDDELYDLGLLNSPKRFNVAMTRAKSLLVVVGDANVLKFDRNWRSFLEYCVENKAVEGRRVLLADDDLIHDNDGIFAADDDGPEFNAGHF